MANIRSLANKMNELLLLIRNKGWCTDVSAKQNTQPILKSSVYILPQDSFSEALQPHQRGAQALGRTVLGDFNRAKKSQSTDTLGVLSGIKPHWTTATPYLRTSGSSLDF